MEISEEQFQELSTLINVIALGGLDVNNAMSKVAEVLNEAGLWGKVEEHLEAHLEGTGRQLAAVQQAAKLLQQIHPEFPDPSSKQMH